MLVGCDHPSFVSISPLVGELWHFQYFPTWRPAVIFNLIFDNMTVIVVLVCCCVPSFIKTGSHVRPPDAHNCWMFNATAVAMATTSWRTYRGYDGMRPPKFHRNRSIGRRVIAFPTFSGGRPPSWIGILRFWTTQEVNYEVRLACENLVSIWSSPSEILRFYDIASLAGKCLTTPHFKGVWWVWTP